MKGTFLDRVFLLLRQTRLHGLLLPGSAAILAVQNESAVSNRPDLVGAGQGKDLVEITGNDRQPQHGVPFYGVLPPVQGESINCSISIAARLLDKSEKSAEGKHEEGGGKPDRTAIQAEPRARLPFWRKTLFVNRARFLCNSHVAHPIFK